MNCIYSENDIALFVEGDLASEKAGEVQEHLEFCAACSALVADLQQSQTAFKSLRQDTVSAAALSSVRARVLSEIRESRVKPAWGRWIYATAYATAAAMFAAVIGLGIASQMRTPSLPQVQQVVLPVPPTAKPVGTPLLAGKTSHDEVVPARPVRRRVAARATTSSAPKQTVVKLFTDDPNIVIYWLIDQTGGAL